jgi:hypothetical protein
MKPVFVNRVIPDSHADPLDSRMEFHANGPYNNFITAAAKGRTFTSRDDGTETFFEKMVEISDTLNVKLRMTLVVVTQVQATIGPGRYGIRPGPVGQGRAHIRCTKPRTCSRERVSRGS